VISGCDASIGGGATVNSTLMTAGATIDGAVTGYGVIEIAAGTTLTVNAAASAWSALVLFEGGGYVLGGPASNDQSLVAGPVADTIGTRGPANEADDQAVGRSVVKSMPS
jgi:hypothetical protein